MGTVRTPRLAWFGALLLVACTAQATPASFVQPPAPDTAPVLEELAKHRVVFHAPDAPLPRWYSPAAHGADAGSRDGGGADREVMKIALANGTRLICFVPSAEGQSWRARSSRTAAALKGRIHSLLVGQPLDAEYAAALEQHLDGRCFFRVAGYWIYELCWGRHLRQFHMHGGEVQLEYLLGQGAKAKLKSGADGVLRYSTGPVGGMQAATQMLNGTSCDLNNRQRAAEVAVVCDATHHLGADQEGGLSAAALASAGDQADAAKLDDASGAVAGREVHGDSDELVDVAEPASCRYTAVLRSNAACHVPALLPAAPEGETVDCYREQRPTAADAEL